jgi:hypothetical protein
MKPYNLNILTQVVQSGWNGDFYFTREEADALGLGAPVTMRGEPLHAAIEALVVNWHQETEADGGVITYYREE